MLLIRRLKSGERYNIRDFLIAYFYWIMIVAYLVDLFLVRIQISAVCALLILLIVILDLSKSGWRISFSAITMYFVWMVTSGAICYLNQYPMVLYFQGLAYMAFPVLLFFVHKENVEIIYRKYINALFFSLLIAFVMYLWAPSFYGEYLYYHGYLGRPDRAWIQTSLQGLYGITMLSSFSAICSIFFFIEWLYQPKFGNLIRFAISIFALIISGRRSAVAGGLLIIIIILIRYLRSSGRVSIKQAIVIGIAVIGLLISFSLNWSVLSVWVKRMTGLSIAVAERKDNWIEVFEALGSKIIIGQGLGTTGHNAQAYGYVGVYDSSYMLILAELGIVGSIIFLVGLASRIGRFFRISNSNRSWFSFYVVILFFIQAIGSNVWEFPVLSSFFWFSLSTLVNRKSSDLNALQG